MTRVLVTGAGGFVGRHVAAHLAVAGDSVAGTWRTRHPEIDGVAWVKVDDVATAEWGPLLDGVDVVVHAAGLAHVAERTADPAVMQRVNADAVGRLAAAAAAGGVQRVVLISSIAAVGDTADGPVDEATPPRPVSAYGASKLDGERLLTVALAGTTTDWTILRPPLVYGPGAPGNMARLVRLVGRGFPLPFGSVANRRSFLAVANLADAVAHVIDAPAASRRVFVVADDEVVSTAELVGLIATSLGRKARVVRLSPMMLRALGRVGDAAGALVRRPVPVDSSAVSRLTGSLELNTSAIKAALDWAPPVRLAEGIADAFGPQAGAASAER